ncbi:hypothetical protein CVT26_012745 [Gymnopilus dilepis]|uniref:Uncharacterized protein n=1 Tax=Gymnopilus dilepis TaxID=231916 RepID=A0A409X448_9AGAR|nr:hypothetical protein CVT26_012745 [Gymnopilus dilepis]
MTKLAARDFEDLLQDLLFILCTWHAYAKLRMHTSSTLSGLGSITRSLGKLLRDFAKKVCTEYDTRELPREEAAQGRRKANAAKNGKGTTASSRAKVSAGKVKKTFNLLTYKLHALGDYVSSIYRYGPSDGFTTQTASTQRRSRPTASVAFHESDALPPTLPEQHHHISASKRHGVNIFCWAGECDSDDALKDFLQKLKDHLLSRLLGHSFDGQEHSYTDEDRDQLEIVNEMLYRHKVIRVNYTSYDLRRSQDSINPRTHADILLLSQDGSHPYSYARVLGIFHVDVHHHGPHSTTSYTHRMDLLWVRRFEYDSTYAAGWDARRLHRIQFVDADQSGAFGFVDPSQVIRGIHLIPAFAHGRTSDLLGPSIARAANKDLDEQDSDWRYYYVNMFVDRDMFMRFRGGGIGHKATNDYTEDMRPSFEIPTDLDTDEVEEAEELQDEDINQGEGDAERENETERENGDNEEEEEEEMDDEDWETESSGSEEDPDEDELGGEDGEEPWEGDIADAEGAVYWTLAKAKLRSSLISREAVNTYMYGFLREINHWLI